LNNLIYGMNKMHELLVSYLWSQSST